MSTWWEAQREEFRRMTAEQFRQEMLKRPWWCERCERTHLVGDHDPEQPPSARCEFTAGSLYCVRENCTNPHHKGGAG
jgi:hypothetical protein